MGSAIDKYYNFLWYYCSGYLCKTHCPSLDDYDSRWLEYSDYVTAGEQDALADFKFERISNAD